MEADLQIRVLTVTQVNEFIKALLDGEPVLVDIIVKGEISNFTNHRTGHFYFTLKDESSAIRAVMFRSSASKLRFLPENGMKVTARGRVSAFVRDGQYQIYCDNLEPDGVGSLYIAFEQLKARLSAEGLFDESRKRPLPKIPSSVGIITSPTGAAVRDMINITRRRFPFAELILFPSLVQGEGAAPQLAEGIEFFGRTGRADVVIIGRGGGSIEDLWAFNDEKLARAVAACPVPVISAVGHETDFTITDFAADKRAPTPSAAAELAVPDTAELERKINNIVGRMELLMSKQLERGYARLRLSSEKRALSSPTVLLDEKRMTLLSDEKRLQGAAALLVTRRRGVFAGYTAKLESAIARFMSAKRNVFTHTTATLEALNPMKTITRGYSAVFASDGTLIKSISQVKVGSEIRFRTSDGTVGGEVKYITPDNERRDIK